MPRLLRLWATGRGGRRASLSPGALHAFWPQSHFSVQGPAGGGQGIDLPLASASRDKTTKGRALRSSATGSGCFLPSPGCDRGGFY